MREESILDVPATMSAFSKKMIEELGMANNADIEALTPGLQMGEDGDVNHSSLRGIWTQNARETNADLAVATYIDGVYTVDTFGISPDLFDLERVEIARGPQGTQHGRNSIGGSMSYVNKRPTDTWDAEMMLQLTDQVTQRWNVAFGGPLNDAVSYRVTGSYYEGDGAQENLGTGGDYDAPDRRSIAPQLRFKTDRVDVNLRYQYVRDTGVPDVHIMLNEPNRNDPETSRSGISTTSLSRHSPTALMTALHRRKHGRLNTGTIPRRKRSGPPCVPTRRTRYSRIVTA